MTSGVGRSDWSLVALFTLALVASSCGSAGTSAHTSPSPTVIVAEPSPTPSQVEIPAIPNGTYTATITRKDKLRVHPDELEVDIENGTGIFTLTFQSGHLSSTWQKDRKSTIFPGDPVTYSGSGHRVVLHWESGSQAGYEITAKWTFDGKYLRLKLLDNSTHDATQLRFDKEFFAIKPWLKTA